MKIMIIDAIVIKTIFLIKKLMIIKIDIIDFTIGIIIEFTMYLISSVWRALRRENKSNWESMRPLWFFDL